MLFVKNFFNELYKFFFNAIGRRRLLSFSRDRSHERQLPDEALYQGRFSWSDGPQTNRKRGRGWSRASSLQGSRLHHGHRLASRGSSRDVNRSLLPTDLDFGEALRKRSLVSTSPRFHGADDHVYLDCCLHNVGSGRTKSAFYRFSEV